jgi:hypothetical protein
VCGLTPAARLTLAICLACLFFPGKAFAVVFPNALILNEYNAVDSLKYLDIDTYSGSTKADTWFGTQPGMNNDGRIEGNGNNWVELVVVEDHLNIQGWQLQWVSTDKSNGHADQADGTAIWYMKNGVLNGNYEQGSVTFSSAALWSDLRAGTIITLNKKNSISVGTDALGNHNATKSLVGDPYATINLATDASYNPAASDWSIHVCTSEEQTKYKNGQDYLTTTLTNVKGDSPGDFSVGPYDWQMTILDNSIPPTIVSGPIGENIAGWGGLTGSKVNSNSVGKLQANPSATLLGANPADLLALYSGGSSSSFAMPNVWTENGQPMEQNLAQLRPVVPEPNTLFLLVTGGLAWWLATWRRRSTLRVYSDARP